MITTMRSRLLSSLAILAVTSATLVGGGTATASAQTLPAFVPPQLASQVEGFISQARAALPQEVWAAAGSSGMGYQDISGGLREGIIAQIDGYRVANGRGTLAPNPALDAEAQAWANRLAAEDTVHHNYGLIRRGFGENIVAAGTHCGAVCLVDLWKNSEGHNTNLLDPDYRSAGMGIAYGAGKVFVVHNFAY